MVRDTLALPYLSDDFDHVRLVAEIRAGLQPFWSLIVVPFHGQTIVLLRLLFWFGTLAGGMDLTWVRVGIAVSHVAGALGCAILCERWTASGTMGWIGGSLYAGAAGFANELLWWPSSGIFCLGATFLIFAIVALDPGSRNPKRALAISLTVLAIGALGLNGVLVAALGIPIYCWLVLPSNVFWHKRAPPIYAVGILSLLAIAGWQQWTQGGLPQIQISLRGLGLGGWLIGTAPLRFFSAWTTFPLPGFVTICKLAPFAWLPLLASMWLLNGYYRRVVLAVWTPAIIIAFLVGALRADYPGYRFGPGVFYIADRYYYFFLFPLVTHLTLILSTCLKALDQVKIPVRLAAHALLAICIVAALIASRMRYLANVPADHFQAASRALQQGRQLVQVIQDYAAKQPSGGILELSDGPIPMDGAWNNTVTLAFLVYSEFPRGIPGVQFIKEPLGIKQGTIEDSIMDRWQALAHFPSPPACVEQGRLTPARSSSRIDFRNASYEENLVSGFSYWEGGFHWMSGRGSVQLDPGVGDLVVGAYAPMDLLRKRRPNLQPLHVRVSVDGHQAGEFSIDAPGVREYRFPSPLPVAWHSRKAEITLTSDFVWHARDLLPQSLDERDLSIALTAIGFGDPHRPSDRTSCRANGDSGATVSR